MARKEIKHVNLNEIKSPDFLKELSHKELKVLCEDLRKKIVNTVSTNGGHLSANLGVVEATVAMCRSFDFPKDKIIFDVGHQCYTYKILTGRNFDTLRVKDGVSGFQKVSEGPYDVYEAGHSSTSISAAIGLATARDLKGEDHNVIAFIGDASIVNGLATEGLNNLATDKKHKVIIIINDNNMSITAPVGGFSKVFRKFSNSVLYSKSRNAYARFMGKTAFGRKIYKVTSSIKNWFKRHLVQMTLFDNLGYSVVGPIDGHNIKELEKGFEKAKKITKSVIVYIKTIKGKGYSPAENDTEGKWHGVNNFNVGTGRIFSDPNVVSWSSWYAKALYHVMKIHDEAYTIVPATETGSCLQDVFKEFPERCSDVGIAEEHAVVFAGGLASQGYHPIISMYSTFLQRAYDQISHDLARNEYNATILIDRAGLVGQDGNTHQGLYDEGFLYSIPNTVIAMATHSSQTASLMSESFNKHGVFAIRFPRGSFDKNKKETTPVPFGKWLKGKLIDSDKVAVIGVGPNIEEVEQLAAQKGKNARIIKAVYLKPFDLPVVNSLTDFKKVIIYDSYSTVNGFASYVQTKLLEYGFKGKLIVRAVPDTFVDQATVKEQEEEFELLPEQIVALL